MFENEKRTTLLKQAKTMMATGVSSDGRKVPDRRRTEIKCSLTQVCEEARDVNVVSWRQRTGVMIDFNSICFNEST